jgi:hypothetical protein
MPSTTIVSQRECERDRNNRVQYHNRPQPNAPKRSGHSDPREKDRRPDVEDNETSHGTLARSCEIRGQTRDAQSDQPNPGKSRERDAYPLRRCPEQELGLGIGCEEETGADDDFEPGCQHNGSSMPRGFSPLV